MNYIFQGFNAAIKLLISGDASTYSAIVTTLKVSLSSCGVSIILGIPLGYIIGKNNFVGKKIIKLLINTLLSLPTVVIGLLIYLLFSRQGPLGNFNLLFTIYAIIIGQIVLALPIIITNTINVVEHADQNLFLTLMTLGAGKIQVAKAVIWEARFAIVTAILIGYGRVVSEVGISIIVGGNIQWFTRTITTAISLQTGKGEFALAIALGLVLLLLALVLNFLIFWFKEKFNYD